MADLHSKIVDARPPPPEGPNSFNFMQFLGNFGKIVCWCPPGELAPPPRGNPGSATGMLTAAVAISGGCLPGGGGVCLEVSVEGCLPRGCTPPVNRNGDRCKNITFPQLRLRMVKSTLKEFGNPKSR